MAQERVLVVVAEANLWPLATVVVSRPAEVAHYVLRNVSNFSWSRPRIAASFSTAREGCLVTASSKDRDCTESGSDSSLSHYLKYFLFPALCMVYPSVGSRRCRRSEGKSNVVLSSS
jgi:hypothetical protein